MSEAAPTSSLVAAARRGNASALNELCRRFSPVVHGILLGYGSIARRAALDERRRNVPLTGVDVDAASTGTSPEDHAEAEHVLRAIRALPDAYRETLLLRLVEGLTGPEIAERIGLTPGSVRVNLHRGMAQLRLALAAKEQGVHA